MKGVSSNISSSSSVDTVGKGVGGDKEAAGTAAATAAAVVVTGTQFDGNCCAYDDGLLSCGSGAFVMDADESVFMARGGFVKVALLAHIGLSGGSAMVGSS